MTKKIGKKIGERKNKEKKNKLGLKRTIENNIFALKFLKKYVPIIMCGDLILTSFYAVVDFLSGNFLIRKIVDNVTYSSNYDNIIEFTVILGIITIVGNIIGNFFWNVIFEKNYIALDSNVEKLLFKKASEVELSCFETPVFYDKYVRTTDECTGRLLKVLYSLDNLIYTIIELFSNSFLLFLIDPWLVVFGVFPLVLGALRRLGNITKNEYEKSIKPVNRRSNYVQRTFYQVDYAKEMRIGRMYINMINDLRGTYHEFKILTYKYGFKMALYSYLQRLGLDIITVLGATLYSVWSTMVIGPQNGGMSIGDCIVVLGSIGVVSSCLNNLVQRIADFGEHALYFEDVRYILDYEPKIVGKDKQVPKMGGTIELKNVSFRYEGSDKDSLKNINLTLNMGERIALVGSNGSGKTTLVKLLLRLYDPTGEDGEITLNGENIKEFDLKSYRNSFCTVFQDFKIFSMSVKENILLRESDSSEDEMVKNAIVESGISEKILKFEKGIDTILTREFDEKGENLSIGEQQKISLARVFADYTPFVLLDEPSSALDPIAEYQMFENMIRGTVGHGVIFISHRLSSAVLSDRIILMDNGEIVETGTHSELMKKGGKYAEMFNTQAENYLGKVV